MNNPLNTGILYGPEYAAQEDMKIMSLDSAERILNSMWTLVEEFPRVVQDGHITTGYRFHVLTDDGDKIKLFQSLSKNPYVAQTLARHLADSHNFRLAKIQEQRLLDQEITKAPQVPNDSVAPTDELF